MVLFSVALMPFRKKNVQFSAAVLLQTTKTKPKSQFVPFTFYSIHQSVFGFAILWVFILHVMFVFPSSLSLSLWLLFAVTGSLVIHQVQTVKEAAKKAWRGTGKIIHSVVH